MNEYSDFEIIWEYQRRLISIYQNNNLRSIAGLEHNFLFGDINMFELYLQAIRRGQELYQPPRDNIETKFDYIKTFDEITLISDEIMHFTGLAGLYFPFVNNPLEDRIEFYGKVIFRNMQDMPDKRFFMYSTSAIEKCYNFWDRIGDLIASYFPENINPKNIYFSKISQFVPERHHENAHFQWLENFQRTSYNDLNSRRIQVVHYTSPATTFRHIHNENFQNENEIQKLMNFRSDILPYLYTQIHDTIEGFFNAVKFIEYLNESELSQDEVFQSKRAMIHGV